MKKVTIFTLPLLAVLFLATSFVQAQSPILDEMESDAMEIIQMNGNLQSTLNGVRPSGGIDPTVHTEMVAIMAYLETRVSRLNSNMIAIGDPDFDTFRTELIANFNQLQLDALYFCDCVITGNASGAMATVSVIRDDMRDLLQTATGIRGEIQKSKGRDRH